MALHVFEVSDCFNCNNCCVSRAFPVPSTGEAIEGAAIGINNKKVKSTPKSQTPGKALVRI